MKILIISYFFPPHNTIGGVRIGKMAKFLTELGHEVRVLTASNQPYPPSVPLEIPQNAVHATGWFDVNALPTAILGGRSKVSSTGYQVKGRLGGLAKSLGTLYKAVSNVPDGQVGWIPYAIAEGTRLTSHWTPDVIYASGTPWSSLLVASRLGRLLRVPWVGELRDLWADNPYVDMPRWRKAVDSYLERKILPRAAALVALTKRSAEHLQAKFRVPTHVILNGFDPEDFDGLMYDAKRKGPLRIVYTGMIYEGRRDPSALFEAVADLGLTPDEVQIEFYGRYMDPVRRLAARYGIASNVQVHEPVGYKDALQLQASADVLLLLLWDNPADYGVCPGKVFEYLGANRPVLVLGPKENEGARILEGAQASYTTTDPDVVKGLLRKWLEEAAGGQRISAPRDAPPTELTRGAQAELLAHVLVEASKR